ncbi:TPR-containing protein DDB_G0280363-like isoform X1 [Cotesia glomerata]|uniref:TPR-containing protein DDB_G0280363-like isoform X1 n=1 Tax=Cotesia glomerata TaxID=32391 RepID=UPI001D01E628|nr:TPR-containing protein DDB_G0280363-like isoform X1 [Cotesia glomerata]
MTTVINYVPDLPYFIKNSCEKIKVSNEINNLRNDKYSGEVSLQSKLSHTIEYAEKAIQHDDEPNKIQEKESKPPAISKTKFTTKKSYESFSTSSSRLKSFPAEEIRRIQQSPKPETNLNYQQNDGQGDGFLQSLYSESLKLSDKNFALNQQHLPSTEYQQIPPEDSNFYQKSDRQIHRPFVPMSRSLNIQEPHFVFDNHIDNFPASNYSIENKEMLVNTNESNLQASKASMDDFNQVKYKKESEIRDFIPQKIANTSIQIHPEPHSQYKSPQVLHQQNTLQEVPPQIFAHHHLEPEYLNAMNYEPNYQQTSTYGMTSPQDLMINRLRINHSNKAENQQYSHKNYPNTPRQYPHLENSLESKNTTKSSSSQQYHEYPPQKLPGSQNKEIKKKVIQFTPAMKHDQELLISKLKQQGISEEIIKRQFDALLTEQKRQLSYLQQLAQPENPEKSNKIVTKRKISRNSEDGKPEWMAHITPPRITYATVDKIKTSQNTIIQQQKKNVGFNSNNKVNINKNSEQTIQYWQANDRQNGMYVNCRNYQPWHNEGTSTEDRQCNCHQRSVVQHQQYPIHQQNFPMNSGHYPAQYHPHKQYPEINPLGNGYFILYDPSHQHQNNREITFQSNHHPFPHDYRNYQQNGAGYQQNWMSNPHLKQYNQPHNFEVSKNLQEGNLNEKQRKQVEETPNTVNFSHCKSAAGKNPRNNGLQDV